tara:strand:- start:2030 stop:2629 length:600 start_codon:yes stop_codon:yes gene_type:complete
MKNLTMEKFVLEIPNFVPANVCASMIEKFEKDDNKVEGSFTYSVGDQLVTRKKNNTELGMFEDMTQFFLDYTCNVYEAYSNHLKNTFSEYGDPQYPVYDRDITQKQIMCTGFPVQRLGKGDTYDWHHDGDLTKPYFIQVIFYLNTLQENQGGCTEFIDGKRVRPETGKVLIYPCSWTFPHKGGEVLYGYKYICTTTIYF